MKGHTPSQNVRFFWQCDPGDEKAWRPGKGLLMRLEETLRDHQFITGDTFFWTNHGWGLPFCPGAEQGISLRLLFAGDARGNQWMAQIHCSSDPGFFRTLLGEPFHDRSTQVHEAATIVHAGLVKEGCREIRWRLNGNPTHKRSAPRPVQKKL